MANPSDLTEWKPKLPGFSLLSKGLAGAGSFLAKPFGHDNPPGAILAEILGLKPAAALTEKLAYGDNLTQGKNQTFSLAPDVFDGALALAPPVAGLLKGMGKAASTVPLARDSSPAAFFGERSKTLPYKQLEMAKGLARSDAPPEEIFDQTGFFKGVEGKWKYEVPDDNLAFRGGNLDYTQIQPWQTRSLPMNALHPVMEQRRTNPLFGAIDFPELQKAYPELQDTTAYLNKAPDWLKRSDSGEYSRGNKRIEVNGSNEAGMRSTMAHELQHGIQGLEGFAGGGNPQHVKKQIYEAFAKNMPEYDALAVRRSADIWKMSPEGAAQIFKSSPEAVQLAKQFTQEELSNRLDRALKIDGLSDFQLYSRLSGEVEARNVQTRLGLTPQERKQYYPWLTEDFSTSKQIAIPLKQGLARLDEPVQKAITWHGSPHTFEKFDSSKIGTGEGAQAYGHGLYLAESPAVAESYKKALSYKDAVRNFRQELPDDADFSEVLDFANSGQLDPNKAEVLKQLANNDWLGFDYPSQAISAAFKELHNFDASPELQKAIANYGNLYKVDLPDSQITQMLDWDKPLSQQPASVQKGLASSESVRAYMADAEQQRQNLNASHPLRLDKIPSASKPYDATRMAGKEAYTALAREYGNPRLVSERLKELGIPGLRYLDGSSRNLGEGSSNFVIFPGNESKLSILERNGLPLKTGLARGK